MGRIGTSCDSSATCDRTTSKDHSEAVLGKHPAPRQDSYAGLVSLGSSANEDWRRGDSNPRPEMFRDKRLQA